MLFIKVFHEWLVLVYYDIQVPICQCLVRGDVIGEFFNIHFEAILFGFFCSCFYHFCMGTGSSTYGNFFFFCRRRSCCRGCRLLAGTAAGDECCCGEGAQAGNS